MKGRPVYILKFDSTALQKGLENHKIPRVNIKKINVFTSTRLEHLVSHEYAVTPSLITNSFGGLNFDSAFRISAMEIMKLAPASTISFA